MSKSKPTNPLQRRADQARAYDKAHAFAQSQRWADVCRTLAPWQDKPAGDADDRVAVWMLLGRALCLTGQLPAAVKCLESAAKAAPQSPAVILNLGNVYRQAGLLPAARSAFEHVLQLQPGYADAHLNLGNLLRDMALWTEAEAHFRTAIFHKPDHITARYNLAHGLMNGPALDEAQSLLEQVLLQEPAHADAAQVLGNVLRRKGDHAGARKAYARALLLNPQHPAALTSQGTLDLSEGAWASGWAGYEHRWAANGRRYPSTRLPRWQGEPVPSGSVLRIDAEQGLGDLLQFARFIPKLLNTFDGLRVQAPPVLAPLFAANWQDLRNRHGQSAIEVSPHPLDDTGCTHHLPWMSLAGVLQIDEAALQPAGPYLQADAHGRSVWRSRLAALPGRKIGIAWQGNPAQRDNALRSLPLHELEPLSKVPGVTWIALQPDAEVPPWTHNFTAEWRSFADSAALVAELDAVVTVCTSVVHLAGSLGVPTQLMCRFDPDWRWLLDRDDSPWYASVNIVRQSQRDVWADVVTRVAERLSPA